MTTPLPPGWYPDQNGKAGNLYWDGQQWHTAPPTKRHRSGSALKGKKVWLWIVGIAVLIFLTRYVGCSTLGVPGNDSVRYEVDSNGPIGLVTYTNADGNITQNKPYGSTFSTEFNNNRSLVYTITAQTEGNSISCKLYLNGNLVTQNTSTGQYTVVTCSARK